MTFQSIQNTQVLYIEGLSSIELIQEGLGHLKVSDILQRY